MAQQKIKITTLHELVRLIIDMHDLTQDEEEVAGLVNDLTQDYEIDLDKN